RQQVARHQSHQLAFFLHLYRGGDTTRRYGIRGVHRKALATSLSPLGASATVASGGRTSAGVPRKWDDADRMTSRLVDLCFDANDPLRLARFWADALRWELDVETDDEIDLVPTDGTGFGLLFLPVPRTKVGKNR